MKQPLPHPLPEATGSEVLKGPAAAIDLLARGWSNQAVREALASGRLLALALAFALTLLWFEDIDWLRTARFSAFDLFQKLAPRELATERVAIVDIDEESLETIGQWPWPRSGLGDMVSRLLGAGALAIGFDMVFAEPDRLSPPALAESLTLPNETRERLRGLADTDRQFAEVLRGAPVALGMSGITQHRTEDGARPPLRSSPVVALRGDSSRFLYGFPALLRNIETLEEAAEGLGLFTLTPEHDGVIRRVPAALRADGRIYPSLGLEVLRLASRAENIGLLRHEIGLGLEAARLRNVEVPTDRNGLVWLRFAKHEPSLYLSAKDIVTGAFDNAAVEGRLVLVGTSAVGLRDLRMTPLDESIPGVELHAQLIDAILAGEYLQRPILASALELAIAALLCAVLLWLVPKLGSLASLPLYLGLGALLWGGAFLAFDQLSYAFDATYPFAAASLAFAALVYGSYSRVEAQRRQIRSAFQHYLSPDLVSQLVDDPKSLQLGGESRELTFLFSDIAGFTSFTERSDPQVLVRLLNEYLDGVSRIVMDHGGTIDKIVGDAVHAFFNAPLNQPDHAIRAVACAIEIDAFARAYSADKASNGMDFGTTRIGVNTGTAIVGNFGGSQRFDFTAHGDAINTAARLEGANKHLGTRICVAGSTAALCPDLPFRPIGTLLLKGKSEPVPAFEPLAPASAEASAAVAATVEAEDAAERPPLDDYADAFGLLEQNHPTAGERFAELAVRYPADPLIALHSRRLAAGATGAAIELVEK